MQVRQNLGEYSNYYAIDGGNWPPKAMLRIPTSHGVVLITIGVSLLPQPNVEMHTETPELLRRIELAALLPTDWSNEAINRFAEYLSGQTSLPWTKSTWLGVGHTMPCDSWRNEEFAFALLEASVGDLPTMILGPIFDDPVNVLWMTPISEEERTIAVSQGSNELVRQLPKDRWRES